jgi:hypothetical protein
MEKQYFARYNTHKSNLKTDVEKENKKTKKQKQENILYKQMCKV